MKSSVYITVSGVVQGIGYRWFVERSARSLGITGWVKNLSNGSVQVLAEADRKTIESFLSVLGTGHPGAVVKDIKTEWQEINVSDARAGFEILYE